MRDTRKGLQYVLNSGWLPVESNHALYDEPCHSKQSLNNEVLTVVWNGRQSRVHWVQRSRRCFVIRRLRRLGRRRQLKETRNVQSLRVNMLLRTRIAHYSPGSACRGSKCLLKLSGQTLLSVRSQKSFCSLREGRCNIPGIRIFK